MNIAQMSFVNTVSTVSTQQNNSTKLNHNKNVVRDSFVKTNSPTFKSNYQQSVDVLAENFFKDEKSIERLVSSAFKAIKEDAGMEKLSMFKNINDIYEKKGFKGLLRTLWQGGDNPEANKILAKCPVGSNLPLAVGDKRGLELRNNGPLGLINCLTENPNAPKSVELSFWGFNQLGDLNSVSFSLEKDSRLTMKQHNKHRDIYTEFYPTTETVRKHVENRRYDSYTTYYKKDGNIDSIKTWFLGGKVNIDQMPIR